MELSGCLLGSVCLYACFWLGRKGIDDEDFKDSSPLEEEDSKTNRSDDSKAKLGSNGDASGNFSRGNNLFRNKQINYSGDVQRLPIETSGAYPPIPLKINRMSEQQKNNSKSMLKKKQEIVRVNNEYQLYTSDTDQPIPLGRNPSLTSLTGVIRQRSSSVGNDDAHPRTKMHMLKLKRSGTCDNIDDKNSDEKS